MPTAYSDPLGLFADILLDAASIGYDLGRLVLGGRKDLVENLTALGLDVVGAVVPFATGLGPAYRAARVGAKIGWSSTRVQKAAKALEAGATEARVGSRSEAAELFLRQYQGAGYRNTTGMSPREAREFFGSKAGTYHWDIGAKAHPHAGSHLQIHTHEGPVIRIFFPD
jgi:hypothetical protein